MGYRKGKDRQIGCYITEEMQQQVRDCAERNGMTISGFLTIAIKHELARLAKKEEE